MNFGWSAFEGNHRFNDDQSPDGATPPIYEYEHGGAGCSISGGALYRGTAIPALVGWYVFGDYCSGQVRALQIEDRAVAKQLSLAHAQAISAVTEGPDGELLRALQQRPDLRRRSPADQATRSSFAVRARDVGRQVTRTRTSFPGST